MNSTRIPTGIAVLIDNMDERASKLASDRVKLGRLRDEANHVNADIAQQEKEFTEIANAVRQLADGKEADYLTDRSDGPNVQSYRRLREEIGEMQARGLLDKSIGL